MGTVSFLLRGEIILVYGFKPLAKKAQAIMEWRGEREGERGKGRELHTYDTMTGEHS